MKKIYLILALCSAWVAGMACTNFLVGKDASVDGSTMVSYAADSYALYGFLHYVPAADHAEGAVREVKDWDTGKPLCTIPQVAHTYNVVGNMNEHQLTIGETTWGGRPELESGEGIDYGSLIYIALERCKTAREAIKCMTDLVAEYGYASSGETFSIADPNEVWLMDLIGKGKAEKGAVWVATRVPDDCIAAHANQARFTTINFKDKENWMWSKDVVKFARKQGYYTGKKDEDFNFQEAYAPYDFSGLYVCEARVWSFFRKFSNDMDKYFDFASGKTFVETGGKYAGERMPLYIKPNHKVSAQELKNCMRDQYEGTPLDITQGPDAGPWNSKLRYGSLGFKLDSVQYWFERPIATQQTAWSFVAQMRGYESAKAGGIFWFGVDDAASTVYVPMYSTITEVPECFKEGNGDMYNYSPTSAWWTYNIVANWAYTKYSAMMPDIKKVQAAWEDKFNSQVAAIDAQVANMDAAQAAEFLTKYSCAQAQESTAAWKDLGIYLFVKYLDGQERKEKDGQFLRNPYGEPEGPNRKPYPTEFLENVHEHIAHE
ncbi:MAG: C69 family dipeptidase [Paludibacteraceae bacterium]|nr:C69 family dipeptidase [Paludibacteraceae bacterium]